MRKSAAKERIIQTTKVMIQEQGYDSINVIDIAYNAKVSVGTFYYHFPKGKKSILTEIISQLTLEYIQRFKEKMVQDNILQKSSTVDEVLKWIFKTIIELRREDKHYLAFLQVEALREPDKYEEVLSDYEKSDVVSGGLGLLGQVVNMFNTRIPNEPIHIKGNEKQLLRVIGTMLTHQIIFKGYYGSDNECVDILTQVFHIILKW